MSTSIEAVVRLGEDSSDRPALSLEQMEWWFTEIAGLVLENCSSCNRERLEPGQLVCRWCWPK
jgi:hypothetical protein